MKAKNVKSVIRKKINHLLANVRSDSVREVMANNTIVTGGAIASMLLGEEVHDFDLYFRTAEAAYVAAEHYASEFAANPPPRHRNSEKRCEIRVEKLDDRVRIVVQSAGVASEAGDVDYQYFEGTNPEDAEAHEYLSRVLPIAVDAKEVEDKPKYRPVFLSANAITLSGKAQLITRFFGEPDEIHANYDYVHCTNYWTSWDSQLVLRPEAIESLLARELRYTGSKYPLCSVIRSRKFIQRGWAITAGQYLKMVMQLQELDLNNLSVLEDQLTGVDMAYFTEVLNALRERDDKRVDSAYLVELIDRIF
jgi:hypothetical protein